MPNFAGFDIFFWIGIGALVLLFIRVGQAIDFKRDVTERLDEIKQLLEDMNDSS